MKQRRLLNLSVVFLIPLMLLVVMLAAADLAGPAAAHHDPVDASGNFSITARRVISIPYFIDNSEMPSLAAGQIIARRAISIPYFVDNSARPALAGEQIAASRVISIPYFVDNSALPSLAGDQAM